MPQSPPGLEKYFLLEVVFYTHAVTVTMERMESLKE